ncbi:unnamed protein product [Ixodes pacificus]
MILRLINANVETLDAHTSTLIHYTRKGGVKGPFAHLPLPRSVGLQIS